MSTSTSAPTKQFSGLTGLTRDYLLSPSQFASLLNEIYSFPDNVFEALRRLYNDPVNMLVGMWIYPLNIDTWVTTSSPENIKIGNTTITSVSAYRITDNTNCTKDFGPFNLYPFRQEEEESSNDYSPSTSLTIYLPYVGFVDLDASLYHGKSVIISVSLDFKNGNVYYFIDDADLQTTIDQFSGQIGVKLTASGGETGSDLVKSFTSTVGKMVGGGINTATSGKADGAIQGIGAGVSELTHLITHNPSPNQARISSNQGVFGPQSIYTILTKHTDVTPNTFFDINGYPSDYTGVLTSVTGYTEISDIHLENIGSATTDELTEIENLMRSGVIL